MTAFSASPRYTNTSAATEHTTAGHTIDGHRIDGQRSTTAMAVCAGAMVSTWQGAVKLEYKWCFV
jgi:hypothetical protein